MDQNTAAKIEGMMIASRAQLQGVADYMRDAVPIEQCREFMLKIGTAMAELADISRLIYDEHLELNPYAEQERLAAEIRSGKSPPQSID